MELIRGLHNLRPEHRGCAVTVGAFDGIHRGHQAVLSHLSSCASERGLLSTVIVFEPLPREYLRPLEAPPRITNFRERLALLAGTGIDRVLVLKFNDELRGMSAEAFIERVFVQGLGARYIALGMIFALVTAVRVTTTIFRPWRAVRIRGAATTTLEVAGARVSSTRIRSAWPTGSSNRLNNCWGARLP